MGTWLYCDVGGQTTPVTGIPADGAIDVGLASRAIDEESLSVLHLADAPLEIAAHPDVRDNHVSWEFLLAAAEGEARWSNGTPVVFIHREPGDSGTRVLTSIAPDLSAAIDRGRERSLLVAYTDADALRQLTSVPGAIGLHDPVTTRLVGASVTAVSVADAPQWKRQLSVFWDRESGPPHFVEFLGTAAASGLVRTLGYEPYAQ
jgi:hypothetical protein